MTLTILPDLEQGTDEWHDQRRGIVTASVVGRLITAKTIKVASNDDSRGLTTLLAAERITGHTEPVWVNADMLRGQEDEPIARALYSQHHTEAREVGFMLLKEQGCELGYSPDGLVGDDGLIEIKSRRAQTQLTTILNDAVPLENLAQCQAGLLVSGREWLDYVSFSGGLPLFAKRVFPNPKWFEAITTAVQLFEQNVTDMIHRYEAAVVGLPMTERRVELEMSL